MLFQTAYLRQKCIRKLTIMCERYLHYLIAIILTLLNHHTTGLHTSPQAYSVRNIHIYRQQAELDLVTSATLPPTLPSSLQQASVLVVYHSHLQHTSLLVVYLTSVKDLSACVSLTSATYIIACCVTHICKRPQCLSCNTHICNRRHCKDC